MDAAKRFAADKAGKGFHAEGEFLLSQRMIALEGALFETLQMLRLEVLRAVDNAQMLTAAALHGGLEQLAGFFSCVTKIQALVYVHLRML